MGFGTKIVDMFKLDVMMLRGISEMVAYEFHWRDEIGKVQPDS